MRKSIKPEARIAFITTLARHSSLIAIILVYRAGYIEDLELHEVSNVKEALDVLRSSNHWPQIRYVVIRSSNLEDIDLLKKFPKPLIVKNGKTRSYNLDSSSLNQLEKRGFIKDGLNISNIISKVIDSLI